MEDMPNVNFMHPLRVKGLSNHIYMVDPNGLFDEIWLRTSPDQANPKNFKCGVIEDNIERLQGSERVFLPVPIIMLDHDETGSAIKFIDGIHRCQAFKRLNQPIPVLVNTDVKGDLSQHPVLGKIFKPLPEHIKRQIEQRNDDPPGDSGPSLIETKIAWARQNEKMLRRYYRSQFGEYVGDKFYEYYLRHGNVPPRYVVENWREEAEKLGKSTEPDLVAVAEIRREWVLQCYEQITGSPEAAQLCYQRWIEEGGIALHRDVVESLARQAVHDLRDKGRMPAAREMEHLQLPSGVDQATASALAHEITIEPEKAARQLQPSTPEVAAPEKAAPRLAATHETATVPSVRIGTRVIEPTRLSDRLKEPPKDWLSSDRENGRGGRGGPG